MAGGLALFERENFIPLEVKEICIGSFGSFDRSSLARGYLSVILVSCPERSFIGIRMIVRNIVRTF